MHQQVTYDTTFVHLEWNKIKITDWRKQEGEQKGRAVV